MDRLNTRDGVVSQADKSHDRGDPTTAMTTGSITVTLSKLANGEMI